MSDLIDRAQAVDAMLKLQAEDDEAYGCHIPEGFDGERAKEALEQLPSAQEEKWVSEIREAYDRAKANPYIRKPLSRALYEVWHRYDQTEVERR